MNQKKVWSMVGLFVIALVVSMPIYSANAMAVSVQITKNQGEKGIDHYIDAKGDVWTVEALISDSGQDTIDPKDVNLKIGSNEAAFTSCSGSDLGILCQYLSPLTDGIKEDEYAFQVIYNFLDSTGQADSSSAGDYIRADGSAPLIQFFSAKQDNNGQVLLDFDVNDKKTGIPSVGLQSIDIVDADTGAVLQSITGFAAGQEEFNYVDDGGFDGVLQATLSGEGRKKIKIRATDNLGHTATSNYIQFQADFVKPDIQNNLDLVQFGEFIGNYIAPTDISVDVVETSVPTVTAYSDQANLNGQQADCEPDELQDNLWHCLWKSVDVQPEDTVTLLVTATDEAGNSEQKEVSKSLTVDSSPPEIKFFGTERQYDRNSYINGKNLVDNRIILQATDSGAGINADGVRANLGAFGRGSSAPPDDCSEEGEILTCYWDVNEDLNEGVLTFGLSKFEDNVGNPGETPESEFFVDNTGPKVENIEVYGNSDAGDKDYLQSNDVMKIVFTASESSGLTILVNLNDIVMDAETKYPENTFTQGLGDGWAVYHEDSCELVEGRWECTILTDPIESGPASERLQIKIQDTAGNDAVSWDVEPKNVKSGTRGDYRIDINGLLTESNPDYWEVSNVVPVGGEQYGFIDLDTTTLAPARLPFKVTLKAGNPNVKALNIQLAGCVPADEAKTKQSSPAQAGAQAAPTSAAKTPSPKISRSLIYNGPSPSGESSPTPDILLEFEPFDGRKMFNIGGKDELQFKRQEVDYVCSLLIYSKVGNNAVESAEQQDVDVKVPFAFSKLGALDENLDEAVKQAKDDAQITILQVIGTLALVLKWVDYIVQVYQLVLQAINIVMTAINGVEAAYGTPGQPAGVAACFGMSGAAGGAQHGLDFVDTIVQVLSCRGTPDKLGWYGQWQTYIKDYYNIAANKLLGSKGKRYLPAKDIKQNLFLSVAGLCLPGIIQNVDKYRQVLCRKVICLKDEVPAGLTTIQGCDALESLLTCKYVLGELWYVLPFSQFYDQIIQALYNALRDPIAWAHSLTVLGCGISCTVSGTTTAFCDYAYYFWDVVGYIEQIAGFVTTIIDDINSGGLQYCDSAL